MGRGLRFYDEPADELLKNGAVPLSRLRFYSAGDIITIARMVL